MARVCYCHLHAVSWLWHCSYCLFWIKQFHTNCAFLQTFEEPHMILHCYITNNYKEFHIMKNLALFFPPVAPPLSIQRAVGWIRFLLTSFTAEHKICVMSGKRGFTERKIILHALPWRAKFYPYFCYGVFVLHCQCTITEVPEIRLLLDHFMLFVLWPPHGPWNLF